MGSLKKHTVDESENVIWKCDFAFLQSVFHLFKLIMLEKCVLTILELNWNQRLGHEKTKLNICLHMLTSSTELQNWSFYVVERTRTSTKCQKNEESTCKACKSTVFHCQMCKFVGFFLTSSSWLLKLPTVHISRWRWLTWTVIQLYKKEPLTDGLLFQTTSAEIRLSPNALTLRKSTTRDKVVCDSWFRFHVSVSF